MFQMLLSSIGKPVPSSCRNNAKLAAQIKVYVQQ